LVPIVLEVFKQWLFQQVCANSENATSCDAFSRRPAHKRFRVSRHEELIHVNVGLASGSDKHPDVSRAQIVPERIGSSRAGTRRRTQVLGVAWHLGIKSGDAWSVISSTAVFSALDSTADQQIKAGARRHTPQRGSVEQEYPVISTKCQCSRAEGRLAPPGRLDAAQRISERQQKYVGDPEPLYPRPRCSRCLATLPSSSGSWWRNLVAPALELWPPALVPIAGNASREARAMRAAAKWPRPFGALVIPWADCFKLIQCARRLDSTVCRSFLDGTDLRRNGNGASYMSPSRAVANTVAQGFHDFGFPFRLGVCAEKIRFAPGRSGNCMIARAVIIWLALIGSH